MMMQEKRGMDPHTVMLHFMSFEYTDANTRKPNRSESSQTEMPSWYIYSCRVG